jgi:hypothetical protein
MSTESKAKEEGDGAKFEEGHGVEVGGVRCARLIKPAKLKPFYFRVGFGSRDRARALPRSYRGIKSSNASRSTIARQRDVGYPASLASPTSTPGV